MAHFSFWLCRGENSQNFGAKHLSLGPKTIKRCRIGPFFEAWSQTLMLYTDIGKVKVIGGRGQGQGPW